MQGWFVVNTKPGCEKLANTAIQEGGFETFFPTHTKEIRHARRTQLVERPLFPLYIFVTFDPEQQFPNAHWGAILHMRGVRTILGMRRQLGIPANWIRDDKPLMPLSISESVVRELRILCNAHGGSIRLASDTSMEMPSGSKIKVLNGPFRGFEGLVDRDEKVRVTILLDILGRSTPVSVSREHLALMAGPADGLSPVMAARL